MLVWSSGTTWVGFLVSAETHLLGCLPSDLLPPRSATSPMLMATLGHCPLPFRYILTMTLPQTYPLRMNGSCVGSVLAFRVALCPKTWIKLRTLESDPDLESLNTGNAYLPLCNLPSFTGPEFLDYQTRCKIIGSSCSQTQIFILRWALIVFQSGNFLWVYLDQHNFWGYNGEEQWF
jgi:hypothetical protein